MQCGLRKKVTEAKEGPLELRRKNAKVCALRERLRKERLKIPREHALGPSF